MSIISVVLPALLNNRTTIFTVLFSHYPDDYFHLVPNNDSTKSWVGVGLPLSDANTVMTWLGDATRTIAT